VKSLLTLHLHFALSKSSTLFVDGTNYFENNFYINDSLLNNDSYDSDQWAVGRKRKVQSAKIKVAEMQFKSTLIFAVLFMIYVTQRHKNKKCKELLKEHHVDKFARQH